MKAGPGLQQGLAQSALSGYFIVQLTGTSCACVQSALNNHYTSSAAAARETGSSSANLFLCPGNSGGGRLAGLCFHTPMQIRGRVSQTSMQTRTRPGCHQRREQQPVKIILGLSASSPPPVGCSSYPRPELQPGVFAVMLGPSPRGSLAGGVSRVLQLGGRWGSLSTPCTDGATHPPRALTAAARPGWRCRLLRGV